MIRLNARLDRLREELQQRGQRRSMVLPTAAPNLVEALELLEEYGALCEALFLVMAAERRMLNVQRQLLRGALDVVSGGRVRTAHMEAMLDAAAKRLAEDGLDARVQHVLDALHDDPVRAEMLLVLALAIAAADGKVTEPEQSLVDRFRQGLGVSQERLDEVLRDLTAPAPAAGGA